MLFLIGDNNYAISVPKVQQTRVDRSQSCWADWPSGLMEIAESTAPIRSLLTLKRLSAVCVSSTNVPGARACDSSVLTRIG